MAVWVVSFTLIVAYALHAQQSESRENDTRFCDVTAAFITSNLVLRDAQNTASIQAIGQRRELISATNAIIGYLTPATRGTATQQKARIAFLRYLRAQVNLNDRLVDSSIASLDAANKATVEWTKLRRRLRCP